MTYCNIETTSEKIIGIVFFQVPMLYFRRFMLFGCRIENCKNNAEMKNLGSLVKY